MYGKFHFLYMMFLKCTENPFFYTVQMAIRADLIDILPGLKDGDSYGATR